MSEKQEDHKDNLIHLSEHRARLTRARRVRRGEELLDAQDPTEAVRALPADEFYYLVWERGIDESHDLLVHASPEQIQTALDFAIWDRDRVSIRKTQPWLEAMLEVPAERLYEWARGLDVELLAVLLRQRCMIYNLGLQVAPEDPLGTFHNTPDGSFLMDLKGDEDQQRQTRDLLNMLYSVDMEFMRELLVGVAAESDAEMEEFAYRWRNGRMQDLGFADYYEALQVYADLDPASIKLGEGRGPSSRIRSDSEIGDTSLRLPAVIMDSLANETPFSRGVAGLPNAADVADVHNDLVLLSNRVLSAEKIDPADEDGIRDALVRVSATLDLAVSFLTEGNQGKESEAVRSVALARLFRLGASLTTKIGALARTLRDRQAFALIAPDMNLFTVDDSELLDALAARRPVFPMRLDDPAEGGTRPFSSTMDVSKAAVAVEKVAASIAMLGILGVRPGHLALNMRHRMGIEDPDLIDTGVLGRTALILKILDEDEFRPLQEADLIHLEAVRKTAEKEGSTLREMAVDKIRGLFPGRTLTPAAAFVANALSAGLHPLQGVLRA